MTVVGSKVQIWGIEQKPHLVGLFGLITHEVEGGRMLVQVDDMYIQLSLKPEKLQVVGGSVGEVKLCKQNDIAQFMCEFKCGFKSKLNGMFATYERSCRLKPNKTVEATPRPLSPLAG